MVIKHEDFVNLRVKTHAWLRSELQALAVKPNARKAAESWPSHEIRFTYSTWTFIVDYPDLDRHNPHWKPHLSVCAYDRRSADDYDENNGPLLTAHDLSIADCGDSERIAMLLSNAWNELRLGDKRPIFFSTEIELPERAERVDMKIIARGLVRLAREMSLFLR